MRRMNCWIIALGQLAVLVLTCGSACHTIPIPLPLAALGGLGILAALLLCAHRERLEAFLGNALSHNGV